MECGEERHEVRRDEGLWHKVSGARNVDMVAVNPSSSDVSTLMSASETRSVPLTGILQCLCCSEVLQW